MSKLKILFVIDHLGRGGAERQFINLVNNIDRKMFEVYVFIAERRGERFQELKKDIHVYGLPDSKERRTLRALRLLRKTIREIRPDVIQTWLEYSTFLTAVVLKISKLRPLFIASHRGSLDELYDYEVRFGSLKKKLLIWAYRQTQTVTTNSKYLVRQLRSYGVRNIEVIYNGIDLEKLNRLESREALRRKLEFKTDIFYMVFAGALVARKGIEYLIEAVKGINSSKISLLILGNGALKNKIETSVRGNERFSLLGFRPDAVEYIKAADLLILPSIYEGLPNVILEAMAVGTPVIATDIYGVPELIEDKVNGLLVPPKDTEKLQTSIEMMINNCDMAGRFAETSRERVKSFALAGMVNEYEKLYSQQ